MMTDVPKTHLYTRYFFVEDYDHHTKTCSSFPDSVLLPSNISSFMPAHQPLEAEITILNENGPFHLLFWDNKDVPLFPQVKTAPGTPELFANVGFYVQKLNSSFFLLELH